VPPRPAGDALGRVGWVDGGGGGGGIWGASVEVKLKRLLQSADRGRPSILPLIAAGEDVEPLPACGHSDEARSALDVVVSATRRWFWDAHVSHSAAG